MNYLTSGEIASKWNLSTRHVTSLCLEGRVGGAVLKNGIWLIPEDAQRPKRRTRERKEDRYKNM